MGNAFTTTTALPASTTLNAINFAALKRIVKLALLGTANAQMIDEGQLVNDAIVQFSSFRPWQFLSAALSLSTVANQNYVNLPSDTASVESLQCSGVLTGTMIPKTLEEMIYLRGNPIAVVISTRTFYYAVNWQGQSSASGLPTARLELYPTPSESTAAAIIGSYLRVLPVLVNNTDVPDVPAQFHQAIKLWCRMNAKREYAVKGWEEDQKALDLSLKPLIDQDGSVQPSLGRMIGVGTARRGRLIPINPTIIYP